MQSPRLVKPDGAWREGLARLAVGTARADDAVGSAAPDNGDAEEEENERERKQQKTAEDPFLNPPETNNGDGVSAVYNPYDWLRREVTPDLSRYVVQDAAGEVIGYEAVRIELSSDERLGDFIRLTRRSEYPPFTEVELWMYADSLQPRSLVRERWAESAPDVSSLAEETLEVDYLFDRVTVRHESGGVATTRQFRQLPNSFDQEQLVLLLRLLQCDHDDWPFEAAVTNPLRAGQVPLVIGKPEREYLMSAQPESCKCWRLTMQLGDRELTWWVERLPPYRLVKYVDGDTSYTLFQYLEQP